MSIQPIEIDWKMSFFILALYMVSVHFNLSHGNINRASEIIDKANSYVERIISTPTMKVTT